MIRITYPLSAIHASPDNKFGAIISAGWFDPAASS